MLKGYIYMDRYKEEWLYYNFPAGSFHTKKLRRRPYSIEIEFYLKIGFWTTLSGTYG